MAGSSAAKPYNYRGRAPASARASTAARAASRKRDTRCEVVLRQVLWRAGYRYRKNVAILPGCPDIVFARTKVAVFCDGDFWHGRDLDARVQKLARGANSDYWIAKLQRNRERDRQADQLLVSSGWTVLRFWESQILADPESTASAVIRVLRAQASRGAAQRLERP